MLAPGNDSFMDELAKVRQRIAYLGNVSGTVTVTIGLKEGMVNEIQMRVESEETFLKKQDPTGFGFNT
jgi:hypothetical protein